MFVSSVRSFNQIDPADKSKTLRSSSAKLATSKIVLSWETEDNCICTRLGLLLFYHCRDISSYGLLYIYFKVKLSM